MPGPTMFPVTFAPAMPGKPGIPSLKGDPFDLIEGGESEPIFWICMLIYSLLSEFMGFPWLNEKDIFELFSDEKFWALCLLLDI